VTYDGPAGGPAVLARDGRRVLRCGGDGRVRVWAVPTGRLLFAGPALADARPAAAQWAGAGWLVGGGRALVLCEPGLLHANDV
jgi:hypothetical protein